MHLPFHTFLSATADHAQIKFQVLSDFRLDQINTIEAVKCKDLPKSIKMTSSHTDSQATGKIGLTKRYRFETKSVW